MPIHHVGAMTEDNEEGPFGAIITPKSPVAAIVGATGVVGKYLLQQLTRPKSRFRRVYTIARRAEPSAHTGISSLCVDLSVATPEAKADLRAKLGDEGITHIFYCGHADTADVEANVALLWNALDAIESPALRHVHIVQGTKWYGYGVLPGQFRTPAKESDPRCMLPGRVYYYEQQDMLADRVSSATCSWTWSASRPSSAVAGFSMGSPMNLILCIAVYASLCKELGTPFHFPGTRETYEKIYEMTSSDTLAKSMEWMSLDPRCANQAFNITNGDVIRWQNIWPRIAAVFGLPAGGVRTMNLTVVMEAPDKQAAWERLVAREALSTAHGSYKDLVPSWEFADFALNAGVDVMSDTSKCRRYGFFEFVDTEEMLVKAFQELIERKIVAGP